MKDVCSGCKTSVHANCAIQCKLSFYYYAVDMADKEVKDAMLKCPCQSCLVKMTCQLEVCDDWLDFYKQQQEVYPYIEKLEV